MSVFPIASLLKKSAESFDGYHLTHRHREVKAEIDIKLPTDG